MSSNKRIKVDHAYKNFSRYFEDGGEVLATSQKFPAKLHSMLSDPQFSHIISWRPHGRAFKVHCKESLKTKVLPAYLKLTKFESFTRQLSGWGFKRLYFPGPDRGAYYHEQFLRSMPELTCLMSRETSKKQGKFSPCPEDEPDFNAISRLHPLPMLNAQVAASSDSKAVVHAETSFAATASAVQSTTMVAGHPPPPVLQNIASISAAYLPNVQYHNMTNLGNVMAQDATSDKVAAIATYTSSCSGHEDYSKPKTMNAATQPTQPLGATMSQLCYHYGQALSASLPGSYQRSNIAADSQLSTSERSQVNQPRHPPNTYPSPSSLENSDDGNESSGSDSSSFKRDMNRLLDNFPF